MNGTETIAEAGPYPYTSPMTATLIGYARCSTDRQDLDDPRPTRPRPGPRRRARRRHAGRAETRPAGKVRPRCARHRRSASGTRRETGPRPGALRPGRSDGESCSSISSPPSPSSKPISSACAPARAWPSPAPRGNCAASSLNCPTDSSGNSAACMPRASIPSAISPNSSPSQDQPSIAHSTGAFHLSVRSCPLLESTRRGQNVPVPGLPRRATLPPVTSIRMEEQPIRKKKHRQD